MTEAWIMNMTQDKYNVITLLLALSLLASIASCGGDSKGKGGTQLNDIEKAAASADAAKGAIELSTAVGQAASLAEGAVPPEVFAAPGKTVSGPKTSNIGNIDPRMQSAVEQMLGMLQRPAVQGALAKAKTVPAVRSAVSATGNVTVSCDSGSYEVNASLVTGATTTTFSFTVNYANCMHLTRHETINGSLSGTFTTDSADHSRNSEILADHLSLTSYANDNMTVMSVFELNGAFIAENVNNAHGRNSARGTFTCTIPSAQGDMVTTLTLGSGQSGVTDDWTVLPAANGTAVTHTGNGAHGFSLSSPGGFLSLTITLADMTSTVFTDLEGNEDLAINGSITIAWVPDLSQWGCLNGTYTFTTIDDIHTPRFYHCPTSGTLQVNNATIEFGKPSGTQVTVTLNGISKVYANCDALGGGLCR
jgi:hypothetical protein